MLQLNKGDIGFKVTFLLNIYIIFMEYFKGEFMYSHTHTYIKVPVFFPSFIY
jgi:hypothetical protein